MLSYSYELRMSHTEVTEDNDICTYTIIVFTSGKDIISDFHKIKSIIPPWKEISLISFSWYLTTIKFLKLLKYVLPFYMLIYIHRLNRILFLNRKRFFMAILMYILG